MIEQAYVAEILSKDANLKMVNELNIIYVLGIPIGALLGLISTLMNFNVINIEFVNSIRLDRFYSVSTHLLAMFSS